MSLAQENNGAENATKQVNIKAGRGGTIPPIDKRFGQPNGNPRHNGAWKKEDTARYKLEQMMKMSEEELKEVLKDKKRPYIERKLADAIGRGTWKELKEMFDQVYGYPKQNIEQTNIEIPAPRLAKDRSEKQ